MKFDLFQKEQDELFNFILHNAFFKDLSPENPQKDLELFITPECNLGCTYCYVHRYGNQLYPCDIRDHQTILKNIRLVFRWFKKNNYQARILSLFSGEIWHTQFGQDVLETIYQEMKQYKIASRISIPTNMCWIESDFYASCIEDYIHEFEELGVVFGVSASIDGPILEESNRPEKDSSKLRTHDFYEKIMQFSKKTGRVGFHPMVSAANIEKWCDNFDWWMKYLGTTYHDRTKGYMMLEVRNDDWTPEKIKSYLEFIEHRFEYEFHKNFSDDKFSMIQRVFGLEKTPRNGITLMNYGSRRTCSVQRTLFIRCGDLSIIPCHRLSYDNLIYGRFNVENNEITSISSQCPELALKILLDNPNVSSPQCDTCLFNTLCMKGCFGSQYESSREIMHPCKSVCSLIKNKIMKIISLCDKYNLFDQDLVSSNTPEYLTSYAKIVDVCKNIMQSKEYKELYE